MVMVRSAIMGMCLTPERCFDYPFRHTSRFVNQYLVPYNWPFPRSVAGALNLTLKLAPSEHQFEWSKVDDPQPWRSIVVQEATNRNCVYTKHHAEGCQDKPVTLNARHRGIKWYFSPRGNWPISSSLSSCPRHSSYEYLSTRHNLFLFCALFIFIISVKSC